MWKQFFWRTLIWAWLTFIIKYTFHSHFAGRHLCHWNENFFMVSFSTGYLHQQHLRKYESAPGVIQAKIGTSLLTDRNHFDDLYALIEYCCNKLNMYFFYLHKEHSWDSGHFVLSHTLEMWMSSPLSCLSKSSSFRRRYRLKMPQFQNERCLSFVGSIKQTLHQSITWNYHWLGLPIPCLFVCVLISSELCECENLRLEKPFSH